MPYQTINAILQHNDSDINIAEAHGIASALLVVNLQVESAQWLEEIFNESHSVIEDDKNQLVHLFEQTRTVLNPEEAMFNFDLFLPNDEDNLPEQATALSLWCQGFLWGIGHSQSEQEWEDETAEILRDMVEFTKLNEQIDDDEEAEDALMQIQEYLRAAVLIIRDELLDQKQAD